MLPYWSFPGVYPKIIKMNKSFTPIGIMRPEVSGDKLFSIPYRVKLFPGDRNSQVYNWNAYNGKLAV